MADEIETPNRVKRLFSSFLSSLGQTTTAKTRETSRKPESSRDEANVTESSVPDARNKKLFYDRVDTFSPLTWFAKPLELSPLVCARYGWENVDSDMLQCVNCESLLCGQLPKAVNSQIYRESCNKLKKNLIDCHEKLCKWSSSPCPESFLYVPYHDREELLNNFLYRVTSLQCARIPSISYRSMEEKGVSEDNILAYSNTIKSQSCYEGEVPASVIVCALCGWLYSESQVDILQCNFCHRKIGLWNYKINNTNESTKQLEKTLEETLADADSKKKEQTLQEKIDESDCADKQNGFQMEDTVNGKLSENTEHINGDFPENDEDIDKGIKEKANGDTDEDECDEPAMKRPRLEKQTFDPIEEHRYWCPLLQSGSLNLKRGQARSQDTSPVVSPTKSPSTTDKSADQGDPVWLVVTKILAHSLDDEDDFCRQMKQSPQIEGLRHLRKVLRQCTSPTSPPKLPQP